MAPGTQLPSSGLNIPFAISHRQQSFRLFELPDELVDLVAAGSRPRLHLKSAPKPSTRNAQFTPNTKSAEYVHLCSEDLEKTWSVRQVSTSNEVYIVQALCAGKEDATDGDTDMVGLGQGSAVLTAIAKADSMLELLPVTVDIEAHLRKLLPVYDRERLARLFEAGSETSQLSEKEEEQHARLLSQIPAPDSLIEKTWRQLCITRCPGIQEGYFIPTARLLESAWNSALAAYDIRASDNGAMEQADFEDDDDGAGELLSIKNAIWQHLSSEDGSGLDKIQTVTWVVRTLWESMWDPPAEHKKTENRLEIGDIWRNALPREYAAEVSVDRLEAGMYELYEQAGDEMIRWTGKSAVVPAANPAIAKPGKRTWHEKFRDSRNVKA